MLWTSRLTPDTLERERERVWKEEDVDPQAPRGLLENRLHPSPQSDSCSSPVSMETPRYLICWKTRRPQWMDVQRMFLMWTDRPLVLITGTLNHARMFLRGFCSRSSVSTCVGGARKAALKLSPVHMNMYFQNHHFFLCGLCLYTGKCSIRWLKQKLSEISGQGEDFQKLWVNRTGFTPNIDATY